MGPRYQHGVTSTMTGKRVVNTCGRAPTCVFMPEEPRTLG